MSEARLLPLPSSLDKKRERKKKKKQLDTVGLKTGANHNLHFSSGERRSQSEGESAAQVPVRGDQSEEDSGGGSRWPMETGRRARGVGPVGALKVFGRLKVNKSCFAGRLEDRRGSAQALGLSHRNWPSLICTQRCSPPCGGSGDAAVRWYLHHKRAGRRAAAAFFRL